jgi:hypothetical protein
MFLTILHGGQPCGIFIMKIKIRDWDKHFERDRSKQWISLKWVPIPNKQGAGYRRIMAEKNGLEIFACWISLVQVASLCRVRGDLSKYSIEDLSRLTLCDTKKLEIAIIFLSQVLDWIEVIENLDISVKNLDISVCQSPVDSSILFNSIQSNNNKDKSSNLDTSNEDSDKKKKSPPTIEEVTVYFRENGYPNDLAQRFFKGYEAAGWRDSKGNPVRSWKQKAQHVWFKPESSERKSYEKNIGNTGGLPGRRLGAVAREGEFDEGIVTLEGLRDK